MIDIIVNHLTTEKNIGLVFPDDPNCIGWTENYEISLMIGKKLGIEKLPKAFNFPIGTMFWAKRGALRALYTKHWDINEFLKSQ